MYIDINADLVMYIAMAIAIVAVVKISNKDRE